MNKELFKYTNVDYLSKNKLKSELGESFNLSIWKEIIDYRKLYTFKLPLLNNEKSYVTLTQTPWILQKEIKTISTIASIHSETMMNLSTRYSSATVFKDIGMKSTIVDIQFLLDKNNVFSSRLSIEKIIHSLNDDKNIINKEKKEVIKLFKNINKLEEKIFSPREIAKMFYDFNSFPKNKKDEFNAIHGSLMKTIKSIKINSLITKVSSIMYAVIGNEMFGKRSVNVAFLCVLSLFKNSYMVYILKGISLFKIIDYFWVELENSIEEVKNDNGNLTYMTNLVSNIMVYLVKISKEQINLHIEYHKKYESLSMDEKSVTIKTILRDNPELSLKQAKFYVSHKNKTANYTLKDFQKYIGSSYEASRYSMENLVNHKFYDKVKIGKKYVYKPTK